MNREEIKEILPHREPMLLVDEVHADNKPLMEFLSPSSVSVYMPELHYLPIIQYTVPN